MAVPDSPQTKCSIASMGQTATRAPPGHRSSGRSTIAEYGGGFIGPTEDWRWDQRTEREGFEPSVGGEPSQDQQSHWPHPRHVVTCCELEDSSPFLPGSNN